MFNAIIQFLADVLEGIYGFLGSHGWSIVVFTILIRCVLLPLEVKSRKGMRKMTALQPKINELTKKYGNDKAKLQQKQSELFKKERYNPLSGCLPMLLQFPLLICMFQAMRVISNEQIIQQVFTFLSGETPIYDGWLWVRNLWMADSPFAAVAPDLNSISMIGADVWLSIFQKLPAEQVERVLASIQSVAPEFTREMLNFANADTLKAAMPGITTALQSMPAYTAATMGMPGWTNVSLLLFKVTVFAQYNGFLLLPLLAGVSQIAMTKFNPAMAQTSQPAPRTDGKPAANTGAMMKYFMPIFSVFICLTSTAGFALYWVTVNVVSTVQSILIDKYLKNKEAQAVAQGDVAGEGSIK